MDLKGAATFFFFSKQENGIFDHRPRPLAGVSSARHSLYKDHMCMRTITIPILEISLTIFQDEANFYPLEGNEANCKISTELKKSKFNSFAMCN
jgi:hypothetical protein